MKFSGWKDLSPGLEIRSAGPQGGGWGPECRGSGTTLAGSRNSVWRRGCPAGTAGKTAPAVGWAVPGPARGLQAHVPRGHKQRICATDCNCSPYTPERPASLQAPREGPAPAHRPPPQTGVREEGGPLGSRRVGPQRGARAAPPYRPRGLSTAPWPPKGLKPHLSAPNRAPKAP